MKSFPLMAAVLLATIPFAAACDSDDDPVQPTPTTLNAALSRGAETATCAGGSSTAQGTAVVTISADNATITVSGLAFSGLSGTGAATLAHIHSGPAGQAGPVVINFGATVANPLANPFTHTFTSTDYIAATGAPATFAAFVTAMKNGQSYINLHTPACPDGEIRGQLTVPG